MIIFPCQGVKSDVFRLREGFSRKKINFCSGHPWRRGQRKTLRKLIRIKIVKYNLERRIWMFWTFHNVRKFLTKHRENKIIEKDFPHFSELWKLLCARKSISRPFLARKEWCLIFSKNCDAITNSINKKLHNFFPKKNILVTLSL